MTAMPAIYRGRRISIPVARLAAHSFAFVRPGLGLKHGCPPWIVLIHWIGSLADRTRRRPPSNTVTELSSNPQFRAIAGLLDRPMRGVQAGACMAALAASCWRCRRSSP